MAAGLVNDGETILIESGSTNALLARELGKKKNITIITTNVYIARQLRKSEQAAIILLGGIYQPASESLVGKLTRGSLIRSTLIRHSLVLTDTLLTLVLLSGICSELRSPAI